ncbi:4Fe-4S binding protein [Anaerotignum lactatifermentans]
MKEENIMAGRRKAEVNQKSCVACGACAKACPIGAVAVWKGIWAKVDEAKCVGCGRCEKACPASIIRMKEVGA